MARCGQSVSRAGTLCPDCGQKFALTDLCCAIAVLRIEAEQLWSLSVRPEPDATRIEGVRRDVLHGLGVVQSLTKLLGQGPKVLAGVGQSPTGALPTRPEALQHTGAPELVDQPTASAPQGWAEAPIPDGPPRPYQGHIPALPETPTTCRGDGELCRSWTCAKCNAGSDLEVGRQTRQTGR
jgi:hypothetical protein